jgi:hypothetical protein
MEISVGQRTFGPFAALAQADEINLSGADFSGDFGHGFRRLFLVDYDL